MTVADDPAEGDFESTNQYAALVTENPWTVLMIALDHEVEGKPIPDDLHEAADYAAGFLAVAALVRAGADFDAAVEAYEGRDHTIKVTYDNATSEFSLTVDWADGDEPMLVKSSEVGP